MRIGSQLLESLPTSIVDLSSLTSLTIDNCPKLERLPDSLGRLNLLKDLNIWNSGVKSLPKSVRQLINLRELYISSCSISELDLVTPSLHNLNLKSIYLHSIEVCKISISEDCCPGLEYLSLSSNKHLTEIDVLPTTIKTMILRGCKMVRNIRGIDGLVNIQSLRISGCPELDALPSFAQSSFLRAFELRGCYGVNRIQGLENCRALERLTVHTRWEVAGIQCLDRMERLRTVDLKAMSRSGVEGCIQSMQNLCKWPEETVICTRAVTDAASLLNSFDFSNLSVVDSFAKQKINSNPSLKWPSSASCVLLCFVVNCESPHIVLYLRHNPSNILLHDMELEEGRWVWTAVITQHSWIHYDIPLRIQSRLEIDVDNVIPLRTQSRSEIHLENAEAVGEVETGLLSMGEVERGMILKGEEETVVEAFNRLWVSLAD